jgi:hypothetical protein
MSSDPGDGITGRHRQMPLFGKPSQFVDDRQTFLYKD